MRQLGLAAVAARRSCQPVADYLAAPALRGRPRRACRAARWRACRNRRGPGAGRGRPADPAGAEGAWSGC